MADKITLEQLKQDLARAKKSGNEAWLKLELLLYTAEVADNI